MQTRKFKDLAYGHLAEVGKALSSSARLEILELLTQSPRTVEDIAGEIGHSVQNTSHHLQALKRARLVRGVRDGQHVEYDVAGPHVAALLAKLHVVAEGHLAELQQLTREFFDERDGLDAVDQETLLKLLREDDVVLVDVRPRQEYSEGHLPGALSIPLHELDSKLSQLSREKKIVAYCRGPFCALSADAAKKLREKGYDARRSDVSVQAVRQHWEEIYQEKQTDEVSWYRPHLERSLAFIEACDCGGDARVVDVGGGASTLVDDLSNAGYTDLGVMDLAASALEKSKARLGEAAGAVEWIQGDVTRDFLASNSVDIWHDRAVLHFLTDDADRQAYREHLLRALKPGGCAVISTFGPGGPDKCSGLTVRKYSPEEIHEFAGDEFTLVRSATETHNTPWGSGQEFSYALLRRES